MLDIPSWTPHDLRRTVRTGLSRLKCPNEVAEAILGHTKGGVEGIYNLYKYDDECNKWLQVYDCDLHYRHQNDNNYLANQGESIYELRLRKICRSLAQNIVTALQFTVLAVQLFFKTLTFTGGKSNSAVPFMLTELGAKSVRTTSCFGRNKFSGSVIRNIIITLLQQYSNCAFTQFAEVTII